MVEYYNQFLRKIKAIKIYLAVFKEDSSIKSKIYSENCIIRGLNKLPNIFIIYDESILNTNNNWSHIWQKKNDFILQQNDKKKGIIVSNFLLL